MKITFKQIALVSALLLAAPLARAQNTNVNNSTNLDAQKYQKELEGDRGLGEQGLLTPGLREKMKLTSEQRTELKIFEQDFANTFRLYKKANQPRIEAALEACRLARASKNQEQIRAARKQLQDVWAGLQPDRAAAIARIKPLLTPAQLAILEDPKNAWRENEDDEANDPSANTPAN